MQCTSKNFLLISFIPEGLYRYKKRSLDQVRIKQMKERGISTESTIYNFSLIKKISYSRLYISFYCLTFIFFMVLNVAFFHIKGLLMLLLAIALVQLLHYIIVRLLLAIEARSSVQGPWKINWSLPCVGYLPINFISNRLLAKIHFHLLLIGTVCIGLLYAWVPANFFFYFLFTHMWVLLPRFIVLWNFKRLSKPGLIKFNNRDASYYTS
jgi:hypothetical protein